MKPGLRYAPLDFHRLHLMHSSCYCNDTLQMPARALHFAGGVHSFIVQLHQRLCCSKLVVTVVSAGQDCPSGLVQRMKRQE